VIEVFRVRGIPIRLDAGWLVIFGLVTWTLAASYFPHVLPAHSAATYWLSGVLAAVLLFGALLLHELSHALAAIDQGVPVGGITLHVFGGVSQLDAEPPTPRAEALIAVVGPLASFGIAGLCLAADRLLVGSPTFHALTRYLMTINLMVGLFNLVPGFPLDGGRLLRATLWWWTGRLRDATRIASRCGSLVALALVGIGAFRAVSGDLVGGVWLVLIGLFLQHAARAAWQLMRVRAQLEPLPVEDIMTRAPLAADVVAALAEAGAALRADDVVRPRDSAWTAFLKLGRARDARIAVIDGDVLVGVVTQHNLDAALAANGGRPDVSRRAA
jgi:Zn-dependent protease